MGKIRVHEFTTMDGVIDEPRWSFDFGFDPKMGAAIGRAMGGCEAILLGRVTYEMFEPAWSARTAEEDPGAPFMNDTTKYVVSSTLAKASWRNSEIVGPYDPDTIRALKDQVDGDFYVSGSATLVHALLGTAWSMSFICSSTRSPARAARSCSDRTPEPVSGRSPIRRPTTTASST